MMADARNEWIRSTAKLISDKMDQMADALDEGEDDDRAPE